MNEDHKDPRSGKLISIHDTACFQLPKKTIEGCIVANDTPLHLTQIFRSLSRNLSIFANLRSGVLSLSPRSGKSLVVSQQNDERWQLFQV